MDRLSALPPELLDNIADHLDIPDVQRLTFVSRHLQACFKPRYLKCAFSRVEVLWTRAGLAKLCRLAVQDGLTKYVRRIDVHVVRASWRGVKGWNEPDGPDVPGEAYMYTGTDKEVELRDEGHMVGLFARALRNFEAAVHRPALRIESYSTDAFRSHQGLPFPGTNCRWKPFGWDGLTQEQKQDNLMGTLAGADVDWTIGLGLSGIFQAEYTVEELHLQPSDIFINLVNADAFAIPEISFGVTEGMRVNSLRNLKTLVLGLSQFGLAETQHLEAFFSAMESLASLTIHFEDVEHDPDFETDNVEHEEEMDLLITLFKPLQLKRLELHSLTINTEQMIKLLATQKTSLKQLSLYQPTFGAEAATWEVFTSIEKTLNLETLEFAGVFVRGEGVRVALGRKEMRNMGQNLPDDAIELLHTWKGVDFIKERLHKLSYEQVVYVYDDTVTEPSGSESGDSFDGGWPMTVGMLSDSEEWDSDEDLYV